VIAYHPTTIARDPTREADALFSTLQRIPAQLLFCYPNADAGSRAIIERAKSFVARLGRGRVFVNLDPVLYWSLLRCVDLLLGNSSSGIMEAASFALPVVNVGMRQRGRERARNVLDAEADAASIVERAGVALSEEFRRSLRGMENPYGDGHAAERIVAVLASVPLGEELLIKRAPALESAGRGQAK
jgi:UDP-N-acetylglucosamine 2-epimerase (non-hydrolysing)/GDP/UDP-N,N'-diacetylbacillosamine 2-epimerase (hydrolysing)